jgi:hypothetical protein
MGKKSKSQRVTLRRKSASNAAFSSLEETPEPIVIRGAKQSPKPEDVAERKAAFLAVFPRTMGVIASAAEHIGLDRRTVFRWMKEDPEFKEKCDDVLERSIDFIETKLWQLCAKGHPATLMFMARTIGAKRFSERQVLQHSEATGTEPAKKLELNLSEEKIHEIFMKLREKPKFKLAAERQLATNSNGHSNGHEPGHSNGHEPNQRRTIFRL